LKVGVNLLPYGPAGHGGAEVYLFQVLRSMIAQSEGIEWTLFGSDETLATLQYDRPVSLVSLGAYSASRRTRVIREQLTFPFRRELRQLDALISNYVIPLRAPTSNIVVVHDMLVRRFPETMEPMKRAYWSRLVPWSMKRSRCVVTVSEFSAAEIIHFYPELKAKVRVTGEGVRPALEEQFSRHQDRPYDFPYVMTVATFGAHKNLSLVVEALGAIAADRPELHWVVVGSARTPDARVERQALEKKAEQAGVRERLHFTGHIDDEQLAALYRHAEATVLPSLYEGFGLPVVEAQAFDCPLLVSDRAALPETAGKDAWIFEADKVDGIVRGLKRLHEDPEAKQALIEAGRRNRERFGWDQAGRQWLSILDDLSA
jgi:glycosyltransferase involved in cell wall biosynthesis